MILILTTVTNLRTASRVRILAPLAVALLALAGCGTSDTTATAASEDQPTVVVTTNILGDVVENLVGDDVEVVVMMEVGTDPHEFQASARQVAQIGEAGAVVANGAGFEEGLLDALESAEQDGVPIFEAISTVAVIEGEEDDHDDEHGDEDEDHADEDEDEHGDEDEDHADEDEDEHGDEDEDHADEDEHGHDGDDPHFFTDPARMAVAVASIADFLADNVAGIDVDALRANTESYISELEALDQEIEAQLTDLSTERRVLVTNHDVFAYFADRYDFDIIGTVIPSGTTVDAASAQTLAELAETIEAAGVPAIFADTSSSSDIAATLADEVGDVAVIELFSESLGADDSDGATYIAMVRSNATRIAEALAG